MPNRDLFDGAAEEARGHDNIPDKMFPTDTHIGLAKFSLP
jgi:hypothetical protein